MGFLSKVRLKASDIMEQAVDFLVKRYEQAEQVFTAASPFGQLLSVIANISELIFTYISHTAEELNISTAQNIETIHGLSRLTGHDPYRGGSAYGMLKLKLNASASSLIEGSKVTINNMCKFSISENGCVYHLNMPGEYIILNTTDDTYTNVSFFQGEIESQTFTSDGTALQSFNPIVKGMTDHDMVVVTVNGKEWKKVDSLYDMPAGDDQGAGECFMVKSSVNIGLSVFFGNGDFGQIPPLGSLIKITYVKTNGSAGNYPYSNPHIKFIDSGVDEYGNNVDLDEVLDIVLVAPPMLGSDYENPDFTKLIAPHASKSFVLATPENYESYLSKYNQYSYIKAYNTKDETDGNGNIVNTEDDNIIYLKIVPDIKKKMGNGEDFFNLDSDEFYLSETEKRSILSAIEDSGRMLIGTEVRIVDPTIRRYAINVMVRYFESSNKTSIRNDIRNSMNKYFMNINRNDIIPVSDLVSLVEGINGVDTCDVFFVSEDNEKAIRDGYYITTTNVWNDASLEYIQKEERVYVGKNDDPRIGFDKFGNLIINEYDIWVPRGGWYDRAGNYYSETPETGKLGPLNIFFTDVVDSSAYNISMQTKFNNLLKS